MAPPAQSKPPKATAERGTMLQDGAASNLVPRGVTAAAGADLYDVDEHVPELRWPAGLAVYDRMVRSDGKIAALMQAMTLPIQRRRFELDPAGAADEDVKRIAEDLGVPILGSDEPDPIRGRARFHHREHLQQALLALRYGSYWFEQVGEIVDGAWRLRKLSPRPTRTLNAVRVDDTGGLLGITQRSRDGLTDVQLDTNRIVGYVWGREGANWYGNSMLRPAYRAWYLKDQLVRADAVAKRRNGMGIPVFNPGNDPSDEVLAGYDAIGRKLHAGQEVSITLHDVSAGFELVGVSGSLPNVLDSVRYHDEDAASAFLAMWMQLGQTPNGSRALGDTLLDVFNAGLDTIADDWYCGTLNEYVIRDWMLFNYGEGHQRVMPRLISTRVESPELAVADLVLAVEKGLVVADPSLRAKFRSDFNLPKADDPLAEPPATPAGPVFAAHKHEHDVVHAGALDDGPASRQKWRELTSREVHAGIDPESMDQRWRDAAARVVAAWPALRDEQIASLVGQILAANGSIVELARLYAPTVGVELLHGEMTMIASASAGEAVAEAVAQGAPRFAPDLTVVEVQLAAQAEATATILAQGIATSASQNAIRLTGPASTPAEVATGVAAKLRDLADSTLAKQITGALTTAQNTARAAAIKQGPEPVSIIATEIMDANTCDGCAAIDGTEYASIDEAEGDYPDGGYMECSGGELCRGFVFAEYEANAGES